VIISWIPIKEEIIMTKERAWPTKAMYMLLAAALAISLMIMVAPAQKVSAACGDVQAEWDRVPTPSGEDLVLGPGSIIWDYAVAEAGDVAYAVWEGSLLKDDEPVYGTWLVKSDDGAATWSDLTDAVKKEIARDLKLASGDDVTQGMFQLSRVATDGESADFLAIALSINGTTVHVFTSSDGGATFKDTDKDGVTGIANLGEIYDFAVSPDVSGAHEIAIAGSHGGTGTILGTDSILLRYTEGDWEDATTYDGWDDNGSPTATPFSSVGVVDIEFSPDWAQDDSILAVTIESDKKTVDLQTGTWGETETEGWNSKSVAGIDAVTIMTASAALPSLGRWVAGMTLPSDYSARNSDTRYAWVWVNYGSTASPAASIFVVKNKKAEKVGPKGQIEDENLWLTSISYRGTIAEGKAVAGALGDGAGSEAGCCVGVQVYRNSHISNMDICCYGWEEACKPPTGRYAMDAFYVSDEKAYAVAVGENPDPSTSYYDESAWSVSFDDGDTWNQLSLIDTYIDYLSDVAVSPDCNKTFLVSVNVHKVTIGYGDDGQVPGCGCDSVWVYADEFPEAGYSEYSGHWLRTFCFELTDASVNTNDNFWGEYPYYSERGLLRLAPAPGETTGNTVYLVDRGTSTVYWNEEETLACWNTGSAVKIPRIVDLAVKDATTIYALGDDGYVAMSDDYARGWHTTVDSEVDSGWTITVHGEDILVGGQNGKVSYSSDGGDTFALLEETPKEFDGLVTVAFDSYFDTNSLIYAAIAESDDNGIYRWFIGTSDKWENMGAEPYDYTGLVLSYPDGNTFTSAATGGVLYASYIGAYTASDVPPSCTNNATWMTGVARSLNPGKTIECLSCVEWDYLTVGLPYEGPDEAFFRMVPDALKACGCMDPTTDTELFAIGKVDTGYDMEKAQDFTVWTFDDCYAKKAPDLTYPADGDVIPADPCSCYNAPFSITWDCLCDACYYEIQYDLDQTFPSPLTITVTPTPGGSATSYLFPGGETAGLLSCQQTYYLRIRASQAGTCQVIHSQWSDAVEITVAPSIGAAAIDLISPAPGALNQPTKSVGFSWDLTASWDAFSWVLSANADLSSPLDSKTGLATTATTYAGTLQHGTTYYWQVKAYNEGAVISTSAIGTFTTGALGPYCDPVDGMCFDTLQELQQHEATTHPAAPATPTWVWVVIGIGAVLVIVVIVLIFRTRRV
jgi:hypothetical protein